MSFVRLGTGNFDKLTISARTFDMSRHLTGFINTIHVYLVTISLNLKSNIDVELLKA